MASRYPRQCRGTKDPSAPHVIEGAEDVATDGGCRECKRFTKRQYQRRRRGTPLDENGEPSNKQHPAGTSILAKFLADVTVEAAGVWRVPWSPKSDYPLVQDPAEGRQVSVHVWVARHFRVQGWEHLDTAQSPVVHHEDRDPRNVCPENLIVFANQLEHERHHCRQAAARGEKRIGAGGRAHCMSKTHCNRGHALWGPGADTWVRKDGTRGTCRYCQRIKSAERAERRGDVKPGAVERAKAREFVKYHQKMLDDYREFYRARHEASA